MTTDMMQASGDGHARAARQEMQCLADEFFEAVRAADVETQISDDLHRYQDSETPSLPEGSDRLRTHRGRV